MLSTVLGSLPGGPQSMIPIFAIVAIVVIVDETCIPLGKSLHLSIPFLQQFPPPHLVKWVYYLLEGIV